MSNLGIYADLASGDPQALARCRISPRIAALAAEARKKRLADVTRAGAAARPTTAVRPPEPPEPARPSLADIHGPSINESRKRAGLAPLTSAELELEFADVDREPPHTMTKAAARRAAANAMAARQGLKTDQAAIDSIWAAAAQKLNATLPSSRGPDEGRRASPSAEQSQAEVDAGWSSIVAGLNKQAGLATPDRGRTR
jgi:hypothetical protein